MGQTQQVDGLCASVTLSGPARPQGVNELTQRLTEWLFAPLENPFAFAIRGKTASNGMAGAELEGAACAPDLWVTFYFSLNLTELPSYKWKGQVVL